MRPLRALGAALVLAGAVLAVTSTATAQTQQPPAVTEYATYPNTDEALLTPGCSATGVSGVSYTVDFAAGGTAGFTDLADVPELSEGDQVTVSWSSLAPECVGTPITMVAKDALSPVFVITDDQAVAAWRSFTTTGTGPGSFTFPVPPLAEFRHGCNYQIDLIVGAPLAIVGPSGSYYSEDNRASQGKASGVTTLIDSRNGAYTSCQETTSTTSPTTSTPSTSTTLPPTFQFAGAATVCVAEVPTIVITFPDLFPTLAGRTGTLTMTDVNGNLISTQPLVYQPGTTEHVLYPGTSVNADGTIADVPGWILTDAGLWDRDSSDAYLRDGVNLSYTVNPTATAFVTYPPETNACATPDGPFPVDETPPPASSATAAAQSAQRTLAATGTTSTTPWAAFAGIFAVGLGVVLLVAGGRRHIIHADRSSRSS